MSHLDLMRTMQRAFFRAELPLRYSEGFNPHPRISVVLPLSLGAESLCELLDFQLVDMDWTPECAARLNAVLPEGIRALEAYEATRKITELRWLNVTGRLCYRDEQGADTARAVSSFFGAERVPVTRKTKRGIEETDIAPAIRSAEFSGSGNVISMSAVVSAQEPSLNFRLIGDALRQHAPEIAPGYARFTRIETLDAGFEPFR